MYIFDIRSLNIKNKNNFITSIGLNKIISSLNLKELDQNDYLKKIIGKI